MEIENELAEITGARLTAAGFTESEATAEWCDRARYGNGLFINVSARLTMATITNRLDVVVAQLRTYTPKMFHTSISVEGVSVSAWHAMKPFTREECDEQKQNTGAE